MNVSISVPGTFHAFHTGEQLEKRDALSKIYTTYPRFKIDTPLPKSAVQPIRHPEIINRSVSRIPGLGRRLPVDRWQRTLFDASVARNLKSDPADIFVGYSGSALRSLERANGSGVTTIVERCSSHIRTQASILEEEYRRFGYESGPVEEAYIEHEEQEYHTADFVVTPSEFVYGSFLDHGVPEEKVRLVPYAVDPSKYSPGEDTGDGTLRFLFAGRVDLRKGIPYLLEAWDDVDLENAELIVAGPIQQSVESIVAEYRGRDDVTLLGWTDDMESLYRKADVFIFPTLEEGSAYVTYEAMASGLPIITTSHSGWVGTDGEHGLEVPIRNTKALEIAIHNMSDNISERIEMGQRARDLVSENFSWDDYGERIFNLYHDILPGNE